MLRPAALLLGFNRLRATYWFMPSVLTVAAILLSILLTSIDREGPDLTAWLGWAYGGGADGARALLSAVAGSMITVVSVTFSVMVVALTVSSQHFGPRLLRSFMRDQPAQLVLGTFTGTFAYCLMVLRTVQGDGGDRYALFVPHLAVAGAVLLALVSVGVLIYYVHHIAVSMQVSEITSRVARELERSIERLYPDPIGDEPEPAEPMPPGIPADALTAHAGTSGYVQTFDTEGVIATASSHQTTIWLIVRPGDFVIEGEPIAALHPPPADADACLAAVTRACMIGTERTSEQDAAFGVQQLVEIALRALSPGTNEPFTAITAIDRLAQALSKLAARRIPSAARIDADGRLRAVAMPRQFGPLLEAAFEPIARAAGSNPSVLARVLQALARLAAAARRSEDRHAVAQLADRILAASDRQVTDELQRATIAEHHRRVQRTVRSGPRRSGHGAYVTPEKRA